MEFSQLVCDFNVVVCSSSLGIIRRNVFNRFCDIINGKNSQ